MLGNIELLMFEEKKLGDERGFLNALEWESFEIIVFSCFYKDFGKEVVEKA